MSTNLTVATPAAPGSIGPILETSVFVSRHGRGLCDLVDIIDDAAAVDAFCDLAANHGSAAPSPTVSRRALETIQGALSRASMADADRLAQDWSIDIDAATRWYGARLTELCERFAASG